jgi:hypothetical protein
MSILKLSIQPFSNANLANFANVFKKTRGIRPFAKVALRIVTYFSATTLIFNDRGELLNLTLTPGNVDDRKPVPRIGQSH